MAGLVAGTVEHVTSCKNTSLIAGLFAKCKEINQCYNTGNISASYTASHTGTSFVGGIAGVNYDKMNNCYNAGNVKLDNKGKKQEALFWAGGLSGRASILDRTVTCCYSTGTLTGTKDNTIKGYAEQALLIGHWDGTKIDKKCRIYDNYYTKSGKVYGNGDTFKPQANKRGISVSQCNRLLQCGCFQTCVRKIYCQEEDEIYSTECIFVLPGYRYYNPGQRNRHRRQGILPHRDKKITVSKKVKYIGTQAFDSCTSLKNVTIKDGVKIIGEKAFYGCTSLKSVTVPKSARTIGIKAFGYDSKGKIKGFKLKGYKGSEAQKYAKKNKMKLTELK